MRKVLFVTAAVLAAVIFFALATLPPRPLDVETSGMYPEIVRRTVRGAYHVHTTRSDGALDKAAIAAAASRAGLQFVIFTDHGDGTTPADPAAYLSGVLCIDGVEISTNGGHYVALGMQPAPYPLGGEPAAVVEDVARLGGFGIAAHPDSPKASLAWSDWDAPVDGIEWLSADSEWRDESRSTLAHTFLSYLLRPGPALASMLDRPVVTLKRWDVLTRHRRVVALAGHDAHGGIGRGVEESGARRRTLGHVPSYEASFRTFSDNVILSAPLTGRADEDARAVLDAIRGGSVYTVVDAIATPGYVDVLALKPQHAGLWMDAKATLPPRGELIAYEKGVEVSRTAKPQLGVTLLDGPVRFEVYVPGSPGTPPVPWLVTNPLYVRPPALEPAPAAAIGPLVPLAALPWHVEKDPGSVAQIAGQQSLRYTLAPGARTSQFVALAGEPGGALAGARQIVFSGSATRPARVSVQLRYAPRGGERWGSSVYLEPAPHEAVISIDHMRPLDRQTGPPPDPVSAALLFVVDLTNAKPGDSGRFTIERLGVRRAGP